MRKEGILVVAFVFASIWVVAMAGVAAVWMTAEARVFGLVVLPAAVVAALFVLYFEWREDLRRRLLADVDR